MFSYALGILIVNLVLEDHTISSQGPLGCQKRLHHLLASS